MTAIRELRVRAVRVPMRDPHRTGSGVVKESPLVLIDVNTSEGVTGHGMLFTYTTEALGPVAHFTANLEELLKGEPLAPAAIAATLSKRFRLLGTQGLVGMALAGIDMALWDALARVHGVSLTRLLGGVPTPIPAYGPIGYDGAKESARVAEDWVKKGFGGVKAKIGYPEVRKDLEVVCAIRSAVGPSVSIMVDYNQSLTPVEAIERIQALEKFDLTRAEEPVLAHDFDGHAFVAREVRTPIQCGENWWGPLDMRHAIGAGATDYVMPEVMKIGGRDRLARGGSTCGNTFDTHVKSSVARGECAAVEHFADGALAGVLRLVESDSCRAISCGKRTCACRGRTGKRSCVEREGNLRMVGVALTNPREDVL